MTIRIAIYGRVSTTNHGQDVNMQVRELRQFAEARGWNVVDVYIDAGVSGTKDSRPELNRLMADAHKRRFDVVAVWRFDRFARSVSHLLRARNLQCSRNLVCQLERTDGHHDASGQDGIHRFGPPWPSWSAA
jgi:DNA invertase Pin-like site-specific DNA recombinase